LPEPSAESKIKKLIICSFAARFLVTCRLFAPNGGEGYTAKRTKRFRILLQIGFQKCRLNPVKIKYHF